MEYRAGFFIRILRLCLGAFFIILGLCGIFPDIGESIFSLQYDYVTLEVIFGIIEIFCGILIVTGFFLFKTSQPVYWGGFIAFIIWVSRIVLTRFIWGLNFEITMAQFIEWLLILCSQLIIGASLLVIIKRFD